MTALSRVSADARPRYRLAAENRAALPSHYRAVRAPTAERERMVVADPMSKVSSRYHIIRYLLGAGCGRLAGLGSEVLRLFE